MLHDLASDPTQWFPMPAVLITSRDTTGTPNVMGIGYVGFTCWDPPTLYLGMNTARHSTKVIAESGEFAVCVPESDHVFNMDYCGFVSGSSVDKFEGAGFHTRDGELIGAPLINECPVNLECKLKKTIPIGSHSLFLAEVVKTHVAPELLEGDRFLDPVVLVSRRYMSAGSHHLANFGESAGNPQN